MNTRLLFLVLFLFPTACGGGEATAPPATTPSSTAPTPAATNDDRDPEDKKLDAGRKPAELVQLAGIKPGMKVADLAAGGGYTTEVLVRAVGPTGTVYSQNSAKIVEMFANKPWTARLAKPVNKGVVRVVREFDDPLPPEAKDLDAVVMVLFYHDTFWMGTDRPKMNASILKALKPGGKFIVIDHSGRDGTGAAEVQTLHRIEEKIVRDEIAAAGFKLTGESPAWKNAEDKRDWNASPMKAAEKRGTSDRFALVFSKP
ncbi:MAG: SAM-dependent methyltransferase [Labilithrix sp.]